MTDELFYRNGLRFECKRCSKCCRHTPGYVFLSEADIDTLAGALGLTRQLVLSRYCRRVRFGPVGRISLKEKPNVDCILWEDGGCSVYDARPLQCKSFPFWGSCLATAEEWQHQGRLCRGIDTGRLHTFEEIERWLDLRMTEPFIEA